MRSKNSAGWIGFAVFVHAGGGSARDRLHGVRRHGDDPAALAGAALRAARRSMSVISGICTSIRMRSNGCAIAVATASPAVVDGDAMPALLEQAHGQGLVVSANNTRAAAGCGAPRRREGRAAARAAHGGDDRRAAGLAISHQIGGDAEVAAARQIPGRSDVTSAPAADESDPRLMRAASAEAVHLRRPVISTSGKRASGAGAEKAVGLGVSATSADANAGLLGWAVGGVVRQAGWGSCATSRPRGSSASSPSRPRSGSCSGTCCPVPARSRPRCGRPSSRPGGRRSPGPDRCRRSGA